MGRYNMNKLVDIKRVELLNRIRDMENDIINSRKSKYKNYK